MIISNLTRWENFTEANFSKEGNPREVLNQVMINYEKASSDIVIFRLIAVGRRILNTWSAEDIANLLSNKRVRIYHGVKRNKNVKITFGWHKIKNLTVSEKKNIKDSWSLEFFEESIGKKIITSSGGILFVESILQED